MSDTVDVSIAPASVDLRLTAEVDNLGIMLVVSSTRVSSRRQKPISPRRDHAFWRSLLPPEFAGAADAIADGIVNGDLRQEGHGIRITPVQTRMFDEATARHLKLPELCPHPFRLRMTRREPDGFLISVGVKSAEPPFHHGVIDGALIRFRPRTVYRAGSRMTDMLAAIDAFNAAATARQRSALRALSPFLDAGLVDMLWAGKHVDVFQSGAFGMDAVASGSDDIRIDPVLFSGMPRGPEDEEPLPLLSDPLQSAFAVAFATSPRSRHSYRVSPTATVLVDDSVEDCLKVVRSLTHGPRQDRVDFLKDPAPKLSAAMKRHAHQPPLIAHGRYAPHVRGIGVWLPPSFPYLSRIDTDWLPEEFIVVLKSGAVVLTSRQVNEFYEALESARTNAGSEVALLDRTLPIGEAMLAWEQIEAQCHESSPQRHDAPDVERPERLSLIVADNFDEVGHVAKIHPRTPPEGIAGFDLHLRTSLKTHQTGGVEWLISRWLCGAPSALLADDMGIGKTFQVLTFIDWITRAVTLPSRDSATGLHQHPILVVVPGTLIDVWRDQLSEHLDASNAIGRMYEPSGAQLRAESTADISSRLSTFGQQPVTITTYEMLNEHLLVFGAVPWGAVVFDEVQRIKDPATQLRHAATGLNADFIVAATGTPVENRIEDLWSIVDAISPGRLGTLRDFSHTYSDLDIDKLRRLSVDLLGPDLSISPDAPPLMLRRLKDDVLDALPVKMFVPHEREMPAAQATAYATALMEAKQQAAAGVPEASLLLIQNLRRITLHPDGLKQVDVRDPDSLKDWISRSARTSLTFDILDHIRSRREKVLLYLDDLAVQHVLAQAIRQRFGLAELPRIINGKVGKKHRTRIVESFQNDDDGFSPIILSSRVGGVGLHLTAANHVIHVSRWWNPALEDQCNDRVHRMGQIRDVKIHLPMGFYPDDALPSFDRLMDGLLTDKRLMAREVLMPATTGREAGEFVSRLRAFGGLNGAA